MKFLRLLPLLLLSAAGHSQDAPPAPGPEVPPSAAAAKAATLILPKAEFRKAAIGEVGDYLHSKSLQLDPAKTGVNVIVFPKAASQAPPIDLTQTNISLLEVARAIGEQAKLAFYEEPHALVLGSPPAPEEEAPLQEALAPLQKIVIPKVTLRNATMREALDFLAARTHGSPALKLIPPPAGAEPAKIDLSLTEIPAGDLLRYLARLAEYDLSVDGPVIVLQPRARRAGDSD